MDWTPLLNVAITALAAALTAMVAIILPALRTWIANKSSLAKVLMESELAAKMDEGVLNIIKGIEEQLIEKYGGSPELHVGTRHPEVSPERIIQEAEPAVRQQFKDTINHFGLTPEAVARYVAARAARALR